MGHGLAFGRVPTGTDHVEVLLTDGTQVPAALANGFYHAGWDAAVSPGVLSPLQRVVAYTPTTIYTHEGGVTHTPPR